MFALQSVWTFSLVCGNEKVCSCAQSTLAVHVFSETWSSQGAPCNPASGAGRSRYRACWIRFFFFSSIKWFTVWEDKSSPETVVRVGMWYSQFAAERRCVTLTCGQKRMAVLAWPCPKSTGAWLVGMYYRVTPFSMSLEGLWGQWGRWEQKPLRLLSWVRGQATLLRREPAWSAAWIKMVRNSGHSGRGPSPVTTLTWGSVSCFVVCLAFFLAYRCPFSMHAVLTPHFRLWIF